MLARFLAAMGSVLVMLHAVPVGATELLRLEHHYTRDFWHGEDFDYAYDPEAGVFYGLEAVGDPPANRAEPPRRLVAIDALTGASTPLTGPLPGRLSPRFFLKDYVVAVEGELLRLTVFDRKTWRRVGSKGLKQSASGAAVKDGVLYLLQNRSLARFALPGMKFIGEDQPMALSGLSNARVWDDRIIGFRILSCDARPCSTELVMVSLAGDELGAVKFWHDAMPFSGHVYSVEAIVGTRALVKIRPGRYGVIDLDQMKLLYLFPEYADTGFFSFAVSDGLVFAHLERQMRPGIDAADAEEYRVFELETGRELARIDLPEGRLFAVGNKLVLERALRHGALDVRIYAIDRAAIQDGARVRQAIIDAAERAAVHDSYSALEEMESIALSPIRDVPPAQLDDEAFAIAKSYGRYLALNPRRAVEGAQFLARMAASRPEDAALTRLAEIAAQRTTYLAADLVAREAALAKDWASAAARPLQQAIIAQPIIHFGGSSGQIQFHDDRVFIGCFGCDPEGHSAIEVYDRTDWRHLARIPIPQDNKGDPPHVSDIAFVGDRMFVAKSVSFRDPGDTTLQIFDSRSLAPISALAIRENGPKLIAGHGKLAICDCEAQSCRAVNAASLEPVAARLNSEAACNDWYRYSGEVTWEHLESPVLAGNRLALVGKQRFVSDTGTWPRHVYVVRSLLGDGQPIRFPYPVQGSFAPAVFFTRDETRALIETRTVDAQRYSAFDTAPVRAQTLIELALPAWSGAISDGSALFINFRSSILAIDMRSGAILDWADPFAELLKPDPEGLGPARVDGLVIDRGRLIVLSRRDLARVIDLERFHALAKPDETPFAVTERALRLAP